VLIAPGGFGKELNPFIPLLGTSLGSRLLGSLYGPRTSRTIERLAARVESRPARDTRNIEKAREKDEKDLELGRQIRAEADGGEVGEEYDESDDSAARANLATHRSTTPSGGTS